MGAMRMNLKSNTVFCNKSKEREFEYALTLSGFYHQGWWVSSCFFITPNVHVEMCIWGSCTSGRWTPQRSSDPHTNTSLRSTFLLSDCPQDQTERAGCLIYKMAAITCRLIFFQAKTILKRYIWKVEIQLVEEKSF